MKILVANRGEIAVRIIRSAAELNLESVAVYSEDDAESFHVSLADRSQPLSKKGAAAYLDMDQILAAAANHGCGAVHPGYGFLAENAEFARKCEKQGISFIGPCPPTLELFGDKAAARSRAEACGIPLLPATGGAIDFKEAKEFFRSLGGGAAVMIKALAGGGGRGMRAVYDIDHLEEAFFLWASEAETAFGSRDLYAEKLIPNARHVEVQIIGDGAGGISHLWERECTLQRRNQKIVEIAPSPSLDRRLRSRLAESAVRLAESADYRSLGTFEFLVDADAGQGEEGFYFLE
ncbi:MAG: biotin carboxylase N-terminal domain-containing protein, partial [Desulfosalsimonas sp.]